MKTKRPKPKKCRVKGCENTFTPYNSLHKWCSPEHGLILAKEAQEKARKAEVKAFNRETKARREKIKKRPEWIAEAQAAFNKYVRVRDRGDNCISCGKSAEELQIKSNIVMVCGHYLSVGAHPALRFEPLNANLQCTRCNGGAGKYGNFNNKELTVTQNYRIRLLEKIGKEKLEWIEGPHEPLKLTIEEIKEIKATYTRKAKEIIDE